ncbi:hypothetical protein, partial [Lentzea sp. NPDC060358]|uniref:hypothetical protein n=1 Tax=Lentzea sp. NPDC060358 TaxID=3347103 RepID=UPI003646E1F4
QVNRAESSRESGGRLRAEIGRADHDDPLEISHVPRARIRIRMFPQVRCRSKDRGTMIRTSMSEF